MRKKGAVLLLIFFVMMGSQGVRADNIFERTGMSLFEGGWKQESVQGRHWTSYHINAQASVTAYIKLDGYPVEGVTGLAKASVTSSRKSGPYVGHQHSRYTP